MLPEEVTRAGELARAAADRTHQLLAALRELSEAAFDAPSRLPGWSRLTIVCHLRYGATALRRMTADAVAGRTTAYYPDGRARQRPATLRPAPGERPVDVLDDWRAAAAELDRAWSTVDDAQWSTEVVEPRGNPDLGTIALGRLALARLTEVEVHGTDLDIGAPDWSRTFVEIGLPARLDRLASRRTNHRAFDRSVRGSWLLHATDGPRWLVTAEGDRVEARPAAEGDAPDATIEGSSRDLLALLLGRPPLRALCFGGDVALARSFGDAFPGP